MRRLASALAWTLAAHLPLVAACGRDPIRPEPRLAPSAAPQLSVTPLAVTDAEAEAISKNIQELDAGTGLPRHLPYGTIADPIYASGNPTDAGYAQVVNFNHAGDAAIWTGHYLAAEAFRYEVTQSSDARANLERAVDGIVKLAAVTSPAKPDLLARFYVPRASPFLAGIKGIEQRHGFYASTLGTEAVEWIGNTSRDQYSGVFFGLGVAYDMLDPAITADAVTRAQIAGVATRLLKFLLRNNWDVVMPGGTISTTFRGRADQQLALAQVGRLVNPGQFDTTYKRLRKSLASAVGTPIVFECADPHKSYYKFNLDYINFYSLIRYEEPSSPYRATYLNAFSRLRSAGCTGSHQNAHFNMIDRALQGPNSARDAATRDYLGLWLRRPRRDVPVDLTGRYAACGTNQACSVVPVDQRPSTDFLWQRSPFLLSSNGQGTVATAAIDYILPYWMARYHDVPLQ